MHIAMFPQIMAGSIMRILETTNNFHTSHEFTCDNRKIARINNILLGNHRTKYQLDIC